MNERPIHLAEYECSAKDSGSGRSVTVPLWITQDWLDGMLAAIQVLEGFKLHGKGRQPGAHELTMFYRNIAGSINRAEVECKKQKLEGTK